MKHDRNSKMHIRIIISLTFWMLGCVSVGCSRTSVYVLNQDEIVILKKGETLTVPYDGTFYSQRAETRVMDATIIREKLR